MPGGRLELDARDGRGLRPAERAGPMELLEDLLGQCYRAGEIQVLAIVEEMIVGDPAGTRPGDQLGAIDEQAAVMVGDSPECVRGNRWAARAGHRGPGLG